MADHGKFLGRNTQQAALAIARLVAGLKEWLFGCGADDDGADITDGNRGLKKLHSRQGDEMNDVVSD